MIGTPTPSPTQRASWIRHTITALLFASIASQAVAQPGPPQSILDNMPIQQKLEVQLCEWSWVGSGKCKWFAVMSWGQTCYAEDAREAASNPRRWLWGASEYGSVYTKWRCTDLKTGERATYDPGQEASGSMAPWRGGK